MATVHLAIPPFPGVLIVAFKGYPFSPFVRFFRFRHVASNDGVPHFVVRTIQHMDAHFGSNIRIVHQGLLSVVHACAAPYLGNLWGFVYLRCLFSYRSSLSFGRPGLCVRFRVVRSILSLRRTVLIFVGQSLFRAQVRVGGILGYFLFQFVVTRCLAFTVSRRCAFGYQVNPVMCFNQARARNGYRRGLLRFGLMGTVLTSRLLFCLREVCSLRLFNRFASTYSTIRIRRARRLYRRAEGIRVSRRRVTARRAIHCIQVLRRASRALSRRRALNRLHK